VLSPLSNPYRRREPEKTLLYEVVQENLEALLAQARERNPDGAGLPAFVEREFRAYLDCGILSRGFCRVVCRQCGDEKLVAFSCKGRGFCPSCGARRMFDTAAHLVDRVLPKAPYRQWVFAFPSYLRLRLAYQREFFEAARRIVVAAIFNWQRRGARRLGIKKPLPGAVSFSQRFSSSLAVWPHLHLVVPDGVFAEDAASTVVFHVLPRPTVKDLEQVAVRIARRVYRWLSQHEVLDEPTDALAATYAAAADPPRRHRGEGARPSPKLVALVEGFSLEAGRHVHENDTEALERLCRYGSRPPLSMERLSRTEDDRLELRFKKPLADGSTGIRLTPMELMRRLAGLVLPPGFHAVSYHGVFASRAKVRPKLVPAAPGPPAEVPELSDALDLCQASPPRERYLSWAQLMARTRAVDVLRCARCGGEMELLAFVTEPNLAAEVLRRLGLAPPPAHAVH
jgi:hypothetical protein